MSQTKSICKSNTSMKKCLYMTDIPYYEKLFENMRIQLLSYIRNAKEMRNKNSKIANIILKLSGSTNFSLKLRITLMDISFFISRICDEGDGRVSVLQENLLTPFKFSNFYITDNDKNRNKYKYNKTVIKNPRHRKENVENQKANSANKSKLAYEFQKYKIHELKQTLLNFVSAEIAYHQNSISHLRGANRLINNIDEVNYALDLRDKLWIPEETQSEFSCDISFPGMLDKSVKLKHHKSAECLAGSNL